MVSRRRAAGVAVLLLLVGGGIGAAVYWSGDRAKPPVPKFKEPPFLGITGPVNATLVPISADPKAPRENPEVIWNGLFAGMADDPQTAALFNELLGGLRVQFAVLPADAKNGHNVPRAPGSDLAVGARSHSAHLLQSLAEDKTKLPYLSVRFEYSLNADIRFWTADRFEYRAALDLAMEDYLLRNGKGWRLVRGDQADNLSVAILVRKSPGPDELRADLDRRMKEQAARARAWVEAHPERQ